MTLPLSRDYDAVDTGPLPHTTVNNLQDGVKGRLHGKIWVFHGIDHLIGHKWDDTTNPYWNTGLAPTAGHAFNDGASGTVEGCFDASFPAGTSIYQVKLYMFTGSGGAGRTTTIELYEKNMTTGGFAAITAGAWGTDVSTGTASTYDQLLIGDAATPQVSVAGTKQLTLKVSSDDNNRIFGVEWQIAKLI